MANYPNVELLSPSGIKIFSESKNNFDKISKEQLLSENGTYTIVVFSNSNRDNETINFGLYQITPPLHASTVLFGVAIEFTIKNCETKLFTFEGTLSTMVKFSCMANYPNVELLSQSGIKIFSESKNNFDKISKEQLLSESGTYTIVVFSNSDRDNETINFGLSQITPPLQASPLLFGEAI
jgi:glucokinase